MQTGNTTLAEGAKMAEQIEVGHRALTGAEQQLFAKIYNFVAQSFVDALPALAGVAASSLEGIAPETVQKFNLRGMSVPREIGAIAKEVFAGKTTRLATAGYSAPPKDTPYEANTRAFLSALVKDLGAGNVGLVTSPTADAGSLDAITTILGQENGIPVLNVTAKDYVAYIDPSKFPDTIDRATYAAAPKYVFPDGERYSQATSLASNGFIATGGRDVTVGDFVNAIKAGNPVVIVVDQALGGVKWDEAKGRPNNGSAYLAEMLTWRFHSSGRDYANGAPYPELKKKGFDETFFGGNATALQKLVKIVTIDGPESIDSAAKAASAHLKTFNLGLERVSTAAQIERISRDHFGEIGHVIATAGYSAPPAGYEEKATRLLQAMVQKLGTNNSGLVSSPTADKGSIDAISTTASQKLGVPMLNITAEDYIPYINPSNFPDGIDRPVYARAPKYVFPTTTEYSRATAKASNAFFAFGGRDATVGDFVNAILNGNRVVLVDSHNAGDWDPKKGRPNDGSSFLADQLAHFAQTGQLKDVEKAIDGKAVRVAIDIKGFNADFLRAHAAEIGKLVRVVSVDEGIDAAAEQAARHLGSSAAQSVRRGESLTAPSRR